MSAGLAGVLLTIFATLNWSLSSLVQNRAFGDPRVTATHIVFSSVVVNSVFLWLLVGIVAIGSGLPPLNLPGVVYFVLAALTGPLLGRVLRAISVARVGPSRTSVTKVATPVAGLVLAWLLLGEVLRLYTGGGVALVLAGVAVLVTERLHGPTAAAAAGTDATAGRAAARPLRPVHFLWGIGSALSFSLSDVLKKAAFPHVPSPVLGAAVGVVVVSAWFLATEGVRGRLGRWQGIAPRTLWLLLLNGLTTSLALLSTFAALLRTEVAVVGAIVATEPLLTVALSRLLLRRAEPITVRLMVSTGLVVAGAFLITVTRM